MADSDIPSDLTVDIPHDLQPVDINALVRQGYARSAQLNAQQQNIANMDRFAAAHPVLNAGMVASRDLGVNDMMAGGERALNNAADQNADFWQKTAQQVDQPYLAEGRGSTALTRIGNAAKFAVGTNPLANAAMTSAQAYGEGSSGLSAAAQGGIAFLAGKAFGGGVSGSMASDVASGLESRVFGPLAEKYGPSLVGRASRLLMNNPAFIKIATRYGIGKAGVIAQNALTNMISGRPFDKNMYAGSDIGGITEAVLGTVHDVKGGVLNKLEANPRPHPLTPGATVTGAQQAAANLPGSQATVNGTGVPPAKFPLLPAGVSGIEDLKGGPPSPAGVAYSRGRQAAFPGGEEPIKPGAIWPTLTPDQQAAIREKNGMRPEWSRENPYPGLSPDETEMFKKHAVYGTEPNGEPTVGPSLESPGVIERRQNKDSLLNTINDEESTPQQRQEAFTKLQAMYPFPQSGQVDRRTQAAAEILQQSTPPDSGVVHTPESVNAVEKTLAGEMPERSITPQLLGGVPPEKVSGGLMHDVGKSIANYMGGTLFRGNQAKQIIGAMQEADSKTNAAAVRMDAVTRAASDVMDGLTPEQRNRFVNEVEQGQQVGDWFTDKGAAKTLSGWMKLRLNDARALKDKAIALDIPGAKDWNENQLLRRSAKPDAKGRMPWEAGYQSPEGPGGGNTLAGPGYLGFKRRYEDRGDFEQARAAKGLVGAQKNPILEDLQGRLEWWREINAKRMALTAQSQGLISEINPGDPVSGGYKFLQDRLFNPKPRKFSAVAALAKFLNDPNNPFPKRLAAFRQGQKDGSIHTLEPGSWSEARELYGYDPGFESVTPAQPDEVYEKYGAQGGTGIYGKTRNTPERTNVHAGEHATGQYQPAYAGTVTEGHMLVDDALAQADIRRYAAPTDVAELLNKHLETRPVDPKNPFYRAVMGFNNASLYTRFSLSPFHYNVLREAAGAGRIGAAVQNLNPFGSNFSPKSAAKNLFRAIPGIDVYSAMKMSQAIKQNLESGELNELSKSLQKGGGIVEQSRLLEPERTTLGKIVNAPQDLLFRKYGDNLRRGAMGLNVADALENAKRDGRTLDHPQTQAEVKNAIDSTFDIFDTIRRDRGFQSNAARITNKLLLGMPDWTLSKLRLTGRALSDIPALVKTGNLSSAQQLFVGEMIKHATYAGAMTWMLTGKPPQSAMDFLAPRKKDGSRFWFPSPLMTIISLATGNAASFVEGRLSPAVEAAQQLISNKDYRGIHTRDDWEEAANTLLKPASPMFLGSGSPEGMGQHIADFFGVRRAAAELSESKAQRLAYGFMQNAEPQGGRTQEQAVESDKFNRLLRGLRNHDEGIRDEIDKSGIGDQSKMELYKLARTQSSLAGIVSSNKADLSGDQAMQIWQAATPDERNLGLRSAVRTKVFGDKSIPYSERIKMIQGM